MSKRIEEINFHPQLPVVRLALSCLAFGFLFWSFIDECGDKLRQGARTDTAFLVETACISLFLLGGFGFVTSFLLLPFRLRFTEKGIRRLTLLPPRFVPWSAVLAAQVGSYKGYLWLELWVSRMRWVSVPLMEYRKGAELLAEIRQRLPVEVRVTEEQIAHLREE
jgi:hypothetical protein